ncbi:MAG: zinc ribbon domain-containing protein [Planctomycetota bacterium]
MPTYDYRCNACEHEFELFQSMKDAPKKTCPECGKRKLERLIGTGAAVLFKGSGFYETDYRSDSYKKAAKADSPESTGDKNAGDKSGDNTGTSKKPDAAKKAKPSAEKKPDKKAPAG